MLKILKIRWVYHSLLWTAAYLTLTTIEITREGGFVVQSLTSPLTLLAPIVIITYLTFWSKKELFDTRRYVLYAIAIILIVVAGVTIYEALDMLDGSKGNPRSLNITNFIFVQLFVLGLQYFKRGILTQYQLQELKAKTAISELQALKAQLNPHFLFNTLNNIYGMNQISPERGSEMIMELSDVMRYHLESSKEGSVLIADEANLLRSYIKLEQLRLSDTCEVLVDFSKAPKNKEVPPLLFMPFVENAFKHGTHPTKDCYVHINLSAISSGLKLVVKNSIIANRKVVKTNIGLKNTKRRLNLSFPLKHTLNIRETEHYHLVELEIKL